MKSNKTKLRSSEVRPYLNTIENLANKHHCNKKKSNLEFRNVKSLESLGVWTDESTILKCYPNPLWIRLKNPKITSKNAFDLSTKTWIQKLNYDSRRFLEWIFFSKFPSKSHNLRYNKIHVESLFKKNQKIETLVLLVDRSDSVDRGGQV